MFYHKDTDSFDFFPVSKEEMKHVDFNESVYYEDDNNFRLPSFDEINHNDYMRMYVKECVEDKAMCKVLFGILSRRDYVDAFIDKVKEYDLYDEFLSYTRYAYTYIFDEWADKNNLKF